MGTSSCSVAKCEQRCGSSCPGEGANCSSKEIYDLWVTHELYSAITSQDTGKIEYVLDSAPALKEREILFPGETTPITVLQFALNRGDEKVTRALLLAGVSPNIPLSPIHQKAYMASMDPLGEDPELQRCTPGTHFEVTCRAEKKELFMILLEYGANPNNGILQVCYVGDVDMLEALLDRSADPNKWQGVSSTPLIAAVKSKVQPHEKVVSLLRRSADPGFMGGESGAQTTARKQSTTRIDYPALNVATQKRDYRMVRVLLDAGANPNQIARDEGLPNALFWATYWGEIEIVKLFISFSKHKLDLNVRKYTNETVFDVARTASAFSKVKKPRHIAKLPLPARPAVVYERILALLEEYKASNPDVVGTSPFGVVSAWGPDSQAASTTARTATARTDAVLSTDRANEQLRPTFSARLPAT